MEQFLVDQQHAIFGTDSLASAQALSSECETPAQISAKFTSISYSKGTIILHIKACHNEYSSRRNFD